MALKCLETLSLPDSPPELPEKKRKFPKSFHDGIELHEIPWKILDPDADSIWAKNSGKNSSFDSKLIQKFKLEFNFKTLENELEIRHRPVKLAKMVSQMSCLEMHQFVNNVQDRVSTVCC